MLLSCKKPTQLRKLLGTQVENSDIKCDGLEVRATWRGNPSIKAWDLCWKEAADGCVVIAWSIKLKGCMLLVHGNVMNVIEKGPDFTS